METVAGEMIQLAIGNRQLANRMISVSLCQLPIVYCILSLDLQFQHDHKAIHFHLPFSCTGAFI